MTEQTPMEPKSYHHGDLRNKLIEAGIELLSEEGVSHFSLRKVAVKCGVSHTAPYSHFEHIEALKQAMGAHVTETFMAALRAAVPKGTDHYSTIRMLGQAYISFFSQNPHYFQFLFYHSGIRLDFDQTAEDEYEPLTFFRAMAYQLFAKMNLPREDYTNNLLALWAMVHGIVALLTNKQVCYSGDWEEVLLDNIFIGKDIL